MRKLRLSEVVRKPALPGCGRTLWVRSHCYHSGQTCKVDTESSQHGSRQLPLEALSLTTSTEHFLQDGKDLRKWGMGPPTSKCLKSVRHMHGKSSYTQNGTSWSQNGLLNKSGSSPFSWIAEAQVFFPIYWVTANHHIVHFNLCNVIWQVYLSKAGKKKKVLRGWGGEKYT